MNPRLPLLALVVLASPVLAQPAAAPLAPVQDPRQVAETLAVITQDPAIAVPDPATRARAQALLVEGVKQLDARAFDQALANFLEAYGQFPSPKILLNIAATLREMGRRADAANTYQRYLADPATGAARVAEVKQLLLELDAQLTILNVRVTPRGAEVSIDGGPFIPVGSSLQTRVRPGIHLVRVRQGAAIGEVTVNGFEGETKEVAAAAPVDAPAPPTVVTPPTAVTPPPAVVPPPPAAADQVDGWLITGTQYASDDATGRARRPRAGFGGEEIRAFVPFEVGADEEPLVRDPDDVISSGVVGVVRIDGEGRGFAGGLGLAIAGHRFEAEMLILRSGSTGAYVGVRYRLLTGWLRPYVAGGVPGFIYDEAATDGTATTRLGIGVRGAAGIELRINGHLSVKGDVGYEHFFVDDTSRFDADILVPTLGVIGRL